MLFNFIRYIDTSWYYNLTPKDGTSYWIDHSKIEEKIAACIDLCDHYSSMVAQQNDAAFQLWGKGIIVTDSKLLIPEVQTVF
jgi:hypothetical protein